MGDIENLRDIFGFNDCPDSDVIDLALDKITQEERQEDEKIRLDIGRHVHIVWLTKNVPAQVVKVELNTKLRESVVFEGFNQLNNQNYKSPGSWFVQKGFIVRSKKVDKYWVQYAFSENGPENLTRSEIIEYLEIAGLNNEHPDDDSKPTKISR